MDYDKNVFKDKTILLPCDDPEWSNFTRYFAQNLEKLGIKKLISTSYAPDSKLIEQDWTDFEFESPKFDASKAKANGKIFTLARDSNGDERVNIEDLEWEYLEGDGDFRSGEIKKLRDEADIIITNPPFSLFREFIAWIIEADKKFSIIGNMNAITYKEVFPLLKDNSLWIGASINSGDREFEVPRDWETVSRSLRIDEEGRKFLKVDGVRWFTNLDHGRRHSAISLMTMSDNLKFSKHKEIRDKDAYDIYENYDAIEVPFTDAIPSDYVGAMGVPISFMNKYNPDQFEIVKFRHGNDGKDLRLRDGTTPHSRILIRHKIVSDSRDV